jgi:hypothetical protein
MRDVGLGVNDLLMRQRAARPVGEAVRLVQLAAGDALDQLVVGDAVAIAEHHRRDLGVEDRMRQDAGAVPDDLDVLPRGVEDLQHRLVRHQAEERVEVDALGQRVDDDGFLRARQLDDAEQRIVGRLPQELGIDGDDGMGGETLAGCLEIGGRGNQVHDGCITQLLRLVAPQCGRPSGRAGRDGGAISPA